MEQEKNLEEESIEEQEERADREYMEREELDKRLESIGSKTELKFLYEFAWKDLEKLQNIHIRYSKLLSNFGFSGGVGIYGIFDKSYGTYTGIIQSIITILSKMCNRD